MSKTLNLPAELRALAHESEPDAAALLNEAADQLEEQLPLYGIVTHPEFQGLELSETARAMYAQYNGYREKRRQPTYDYDGLDKASKLIVMHLAAWHLREVRKAAGR